MPGLIAAWANTRVIFCNAIFLSRPVTDLADLEERAAALAAYLKPKENGPLFVACKEWIPEALRDNANVLFAEAGLSAAIRITGMAAGELPPPRHLVTGVEYERVSNEATRTQLADINAAAYGIPTEDMREALAAPQIWTDEYAGYVVKLEGRAVAAAAAMEMNGSLYVTCVATLPECRRRGYAEAAMRCALNSAGNAGAPMRTTLHATESGRPVYLGMGYHDTSTFIGYTRPAA